MSKTNKIIYFVIVVLVFVLPLSFSIFKKEVRAEALLTNDITIYDKNFQENINTYNDTNKLLIDINNEVTEIDISQFNEKEALVSLTVSFMNDINYAVVKNMFKNSTTKNILYIDMSSNFDTTLEIITTTKVKYELVNEYNNYFIIRAVLTSNRKIENSLNKYVSNVIIYKSDLTDSQKVVCNNFYNELINPVCEHQSEDDNNHNVVYDCFADNLICNFLKTYATYNFLTALNHKQSCCNASSQVEQVEIWGCRFCGTKADKEFSCYCTFSIDGVSRFPNCKNCSNNYLFEAKKDNVKLSIGVNLSALKTRNDFSTELEYKLYLLKRSNAGRTFDKNKVYLLYSDRIDIKEVTINENSTFWTSKGHPNAAYAIDTLFDKYYNYSGGTDHVIRYNFLRSNQKLSRIYSNLKDSETGFIIGSIDNVDKNYILYTHDVFGTTAEPRYIYFDIVTKQCVVTYKYLDEDMNYVSFSYISEYGEPFANVPNISHIKVPNAVFSTWSFPGDKIIEDCEVLAQYDYKISNVVFVSNGETIYSTSVASNKTIRSLLNFTVADYQKNGRNYSFDFWQNKDNVRINLDDYVCEDMILYASFKDTTTFENRLRLFFLTSWWFDVYDSLGSTFLIGWLLQIFYILISILFIPVVIFSIVKIARIIKNR